MSNTNESAPKEQMDSTQAGESSAKEARESQAFLGMVMQLQRLVAIAHDTYETLCTKVSMNDFDNPVLVSVVANCCHEISELYLHMYGVDGNEGPSDPDGSPGGVDANGTMMAFHFNLSSRNAFEVLGLMSHADDRTMVGARHREMLNYLAHAFLQEELPFPDDADDELIRLTEANRAWADEQTRQFHETLEKSMAEMERQGASIN